jgi:hypothetical protein
MKLKGREIVFRTDPETSERLLHVDDYHDSDDGLKGTELTAWFGPSLLSLALRTAVLFVLIILAVMGIFRAQFDKYCEAQKLR